MKDIALQVLASYPKEPDVHITSDGFSFFKKKEADDHAKTLQNKSVESFLRKELFKIENSKTENINGNA